MTRIAKTLHLLRVVGPVDDTYRRQMNRQHTVQESRHKLAGDICHRRRGQIMQVYKTGPPRSRPAPSWSGSLGAGTDPDAP